MITKQVWLDEFEELVNQLIDSIVNYCSEDDGIDFTIQEGSIVDSIDYHTMCLSNKIKKLRIEMKKNK